MTKPHITRTLGPIHFEDLDPHRFEDLARQLIYDFKHWQTIESTGRGGSDDGFDVRAYEAIQPPASPDEEDVQDDGPHPMDGNLWMVQCKREKELGPKRVEAIIREAVNPDSPPYGYILAAPTHFSKSAHDRFREELRTRGVMEFYLWGSGELEDMLYQPRNDHILFAFFGISLASVRRSRTTEIRTTVNIKNKLARVLGDDPRHGAVLVRDLKDVHYPYSEGYADFEKRPRWKEYSVCELHPLGLVVSVARYYAFIDRPKAQWDFTSGINIIMPPLRQALRQEDDAKEELRDAIKGFWERLPQANQAFFVHHGLLRFDSIALVDDKGDTAFRCPHLYVDFRGERGPFSGSSKYLEINQHRDESLDGLDRVKIFPETFPKPAFGTIHKNKFIPVDDITRARLKRNDGPITLYFADKKFHFLKPCDVIGVDKAKDGDKEEKATLLKITYVESRMGKQILNASKDDPVVKIEVERQISRQLRSADIVQVVEALVIYDWQTEQNRPVS